MLSADTIVPDPANPQSLNRYSYVNNNPINFTDPSGHCQIASGQADQDGNQLFNCAVSDNEEDGTILVNEYSQEYQVWNARIQDTWELLNYHSYSIGRSYSDFKAWALEGGFFFYTAAYTDTDLPTGGNRLLSYQPLMGKAGNGNTVIAKRDGKPIYLIAYTDISGSVRGPGQQVLLPISSLSSNQQQAFQSFMDNTDEFANYHNGTLPIGFRGDGKQKDLIPIFTALDVAGNMENARLFSSNAQLALNDPNDGFRSNGFAWGYNPLFFTDGIKPRPSTGSNPLFP